jgi:hypothetical protein
MKVLEPEQWNIMVAAEYQNSDKARSMYEHGLDPQCALGIIICCYTNQGGCHLRLVAQFFSSKEVTDL